MVGGGIARAGRTHVLLGKCSSFPFPARLAIKCAALITINKLLKLQINVWFGFGTAVSNQRSSRNREDVNNVNLAILIFCANKKLIYLKYVEIFIISLIIVIGFIPSIFCILFYSFKINCVLNDRL